MTNINELAAGEARSKIFCSLVMKEGEIKRGVVVSRMHISEQTLAREYKSWLDQYPNIRYYPQDRIFRYEP